jgi:translation initiation factor 3 subunit C
MTSRFFAASDSDSSSEESSEEELYSEQEDSNEGSGSDSDDNDSDSDSDSEGGAGANKFLKEADSESDSDEDDGQKVLKSAKDKRFEELEGTIRLIENAEKINDWAVIQDRKLPNCRLEGRPWRGMRRYAGSEHC